VLYFLAHSPHIPTVVEMRNASFAAVPGLNVSARARSVRDSIGFGPKQLSITPLMVRIQNPPPERSQVQLYIAAHRLALDFASAAAARVRKDRRISRRLEAGARYGTRVK